MDYEVALPQTLDILELGKEFQSGILLCGKIQNFLVEGRLFDNLTVFFKKSFGNEITKGMGIELIIKDLLLFIRHNFFKIPMSYIIDRCIENTTRLKRCGNSLISQMKTVG